MVGDMTWLVRHVDATDLEGIEGLLEQLGYPTAVDALARRVAAWAASPERELLVAAEDEVRSGWSR